MGKSLVVVESPAKAKTINKFLGSDYIVKASVGHVKNLPKNKLGVDIEDNFKAEYVTIRGKAKVLAEIKKIAKSTENIYLAPDPDREGEAIAYHIAQEIKGKKNNIFRVTFNEITQETVRRAFDSPGKINQDKVDAQQTRRILDRLVGYKISPLLWQKVGRGLSAGRVQSVALRLVCEREKKISDFKSEEYWLITAELQGKNPPPFEAKLVNLGSKKLKLGNKIESEKVLKDLEGKAFVVDQILQKKVKRYPVPPFTTSKIQQEASRRLGFSTKKTMMLAQRLYEGIDIGKESVGLITYMRTDSTRVSKGAQEEARQLIASRFGSEYLPEKIVHYKNKKGIQDAHEAVRPTSVFRDPESLKKYLEKDSYLLYKLIWNRFMASQMKPALFNQTKIDIKVDKYLFKASGAVMIFSGFMKVYIEGKDNGDKNSELNEEKTSEKEKILPKLSKGELLSLLNLSPTQHFTQPPPRFTEATLVKELEEKGIGRPSTYSMILSTIQERDYARKTKGKFYPTDLGQLITDLLVENFSDILDVEFTAKMENQLDDIEGGEANWTAILQEFYEQFTQTLSKAQVNMRNVKKEQIPTDITCDKCGQKMVIKWGRNGQFLACPAYPECKNTKEFTKDENGQIKVVEEKVTSKKCKKCDGPMVAKKGRFGEFLACSDYPTCKYTEAIDTGIGCPEKGCNGFLTPKKTKRGKPFYSCSNYPKCKFALWEKPFSKPCPKCGASFMVEKRNKRETIIKCWREECGYIEEEKGHK